MEGSQQMGAGDLPRHPLADKFLHSRPLPAIAYQYAKFQMPSSISSGDMEGLLKYKLGAAVPPSGQMFIQSASARKCLQVC